MCDLPTPAETMPCALSAAGTFASGSEVSGNGDGAAGVGEGIPSVPTCGTVNADGSGCESWYCSFRPTRYACAVDRKSVV